MDTRAQYNRRGRHRAAMFLLAGALVVTLAGCGDDADKADDPSGASASSTGSSAASSTPSPSKKTLDTSNWPTCSQAWVAGKRLPSGYRGCLDGSQPVRAKKTWCESGQVFVTYEGRFYAVLGGPVNETGGLSRSPVYKKAVRACLG